MSTFPSISGTAITLTGTITGPIIDTDATITGPIGSTITGRITIHATDIITKHGAIRDGIIQGIATSVTDVTGTTGVIGVTAATTVRGRLGLLA